MQELQVDGRFDRASSQLHPLRPRTLYHSISDCLLPDVHNRGLRGAPSQGIFDQGSRYSRLAKKSKVSSPLLGVRRHRSSVSKRERTPAMPSMRRGYSNSRRLSTGSQPPMGLVHLGRRVGRCQYYVSIPRCRANRTETRIANR